MTKINALPSSWTCAAHDFVLLSFTLFNIEPGSLKVEKCYIDAHVKEFTNTLSKHYTVDVFSCMFLDPCFSYF